jgi:hypothetical protein
MTDFPPLLTEPMIESYHRVAPRDQAAEAWLIAQHHDGWYIGDATQAEWNAAYTAVTAIPPSASNAPDRNALLLTPNPTTTRVTSGRIEVSEFHFAAVCPGCGGNLRMVNSVTRAGTETVAALSCTECPREWSLTLHLRPMGRVEHKRRQRVRVDA